MKTSTGRNVVVIAVLALAAQLSTSVAYAEGKFRLSMQGRAGFSILQVSEIDGAREGVLDGAPVAVYRDPDLLELNFGGQRESLEVRIDGKYTQYSGFLHSKPSRITHVAYKDGFYVYGDMDGTRFHADINQKKGTVYLYWPYDDEIELVIQLKKDSANPGACKGDFMAVGMTGAEDIAQFFCKSEGSMLDAFFKNPDDVISWLIYPNVFPMEDDGEWKLFL